MRKTTVTQPEAATKESRCRHHWLIESPHGPTSMGICKLCGAQKEFRNSASDLLWEDNPLSELSSGRWSKPHDLHAPADKEAADGTSTTATGAGGSTRLT